MSATTMYSLPLTATVGGGDYDDVFASSDAHARFMSSFAACNPGHNNTNNEDMLSPDLYYGCSSQTSRPSTTTTSPHTNTSSVPQHQLHQFIHSNNNANIATPGFSTHHSSRGRHSPSSSDSSGGGGGNDRGIPKKATRYSGTASTPAAALSSSNPTIDHLAERGDRRQRNTEAARRYRQRKLDRVAELEEALAAVSKEREDFKMKLARAEAEVEVLRSLVKKA